MKSKMILDRYLEFDKDETEYYEWLIKVFHLVPSLDWNLVKIPEFEFSYGDNKIHLRREYIKQESPYLPIDLRIELAKRIEKEQFEDPYLGYGDYRLPNFVHDGKDFYIVDLQGFAIAPPEKRRVKFDKNFGNYLRTNRNEV